MRDFNKHLIRKGLVVLFLTLGFAGPIAALAAGPSAINLGSAGNFAILAKTGISTTGSTSIVGNIGVSPAAATYLTGFGLTMDSSNMFSTSPIVNGKIYASDYAMPTPTTMTTAISDMQTAYVDAAGRTNPTATELGAGNIGGLTLAPGLYTWSTGVTIPTNLTLAGGANDVWIFQIAQNLDMSSAAQIILSGGAQPQNIFWVVAGQTTIGTTAVFNGNILDQTTIVLNTGATLNGRALAQAAVTLDANMVTAPTLSASTPISTPISTPATSTVNTLTTITSTVTPAPSTLSNPTLVQTQTTQTPNTNAALQTQLNGLLADLQSLQTEATQQSTVIKTVTANLAKGSRGSNVTTLQEFLTSHDKGPAAQTLAVAGDTGYFGALTKAALAEFQAQVGINPASGNFGPVTRAYLKANY